MADIKSPEERSLNMAKIRGKDTKPEVWLRKTLHSKGYRYRKNVNTVVERRILSGTSDATFEDAAA